MNHSDSALTAATLAQHLQTYLTENGHRIALRSFKHRPREQHVILCDFDETGLSRISAYVQDKLIFFEAAIPMTSADVDAVVSLVNRLNLESVTGTFQYDARDGELTWTVYLAARHQWPGDGNIEAALLLGREMSALLY